MAAPIGSQIFGEVLPYLEVKKDNETEEIKEEVIVPNIEGMTVQEAESALKDVGLEINLSNEEVDKKETKVQEQLPKPGIKVYKGTKISVTI